MIIEFIKDYKDPRRGVIKKGKKIDCLPDYGNKRIKEKYAVLVQVNDFQTALEKKIQKAEEQNDKE